MIEAKDALGNDIKKGSIITYPVRQSSSMWMSFAVVRDIKKQKNDWNQEEVVLSVLSINPRWTGSGKVKLRKTKVTVHERAIVLPSALLRPNENEIHKALMNEQGKILCP